MLNSPLLDGLESATIETPRLRQFVITRGSPDGVPVVFVHGNASASRFFEETLLALPPQYYGVAVDLRGYGRTEKKPVDATRGMRDFSDDLHALVETMGLRRPHFVGWSMGTNVLMQYAIDHPDNIASLTFAAAASPFGFGGTRDLEGTPTTPDFAGTGGGTANPEFVKSLAAGDRGAENPVSARNTMNGFYVKPPFRSPREDVFVDEMLMMALGDDNYPGDMTAVESWPGVGPGTRGVNNALSPKYLNLAAFATIEPKPPVLWIRGDSDQIVSDTSLFDFGFLGQIGAVPGWPGAEACPPQPMVSQVRAVLDRYTDGGGRYREIVFENCGHSPHVEQPEAFNRALHAFLEETQG
jgi:pimeloyl-ACP methyl ester carboxylesterase